MNLSEFKAWFSGFTENMDSTPNEKQWARIKERVAEIDGKPITQTVYVDRYVDRYPYRPYWSNGPYISTSPYICGSSTSAVDAGLAMTSASTDYKNWSDKNPASPTTEFNGESAMNALGAAEFKEMFQ